MSILAGFKPVIAPCPPPKDNRVKDAAFYSEIIRIVEMHLKSFCDETSSRALKYFVESFCNQPQPHSEVEVPEVTCFFDDPASVKNILKACTKKNKPYRISDAKRLYFIEEIRYLVLLTLASKRTANRSYLKQCHIYVHLIELYLIKQYSMFEKVNEFLNVNFKLSDDDWKGHACRGNFGELQRIMPELTDAIEEYIEIDKDSKRNGCSRKELLENWRLKHNISNSLFVILSGNYNDFKSEIEEYCYSLAYNKETDYRNEYIDILNGDFKALIENSSSWLKLVVMLSCTVDLPLRAYERVFEEIFLEVFDVDYQIGLDYLSYSRSSAYYFNLILQDIKLNNLTVESLIRFAKRNGIDNTLLVSEYANILQSQKEYDQLCRFMLNHSVCGLEYERDFLVYFVKNFYKYKSFVEEKFLQDDSNLFVYRMHKLLFLGYDEFRFMIECKHFEWFVEDIVDSILESKMTDDYLLIKCLERIVELEQNTGGLWKKEKLKIAERISR